MEKFENQLLTPQQVSDVLQLGGGPRGHVRYRLQDVEDWMFEDAKPGEQK